MPTLEFGTETETLMTFQEFRLPLARGWQEKAEIMRPHCVTASHLGGNVVLKMLHLSTEVMGMEAWNVGTHAEASLRESSVLQRAGTPVNGSCDWLQ
jgi:hypothetical protein